MVLMLGKLHIFDKTFEEAPQIHRFCLQLSFKNVVFQYDPAINP
jgi:hypothetical protein